MKLEGKLPMCWSFVSERLSQQHAMKLSKPIESLLKKNTRRSLQRTTKSCGAHVFGVHRICIYSCRGRENDRKVHLTLRWMDTKTSYLDGSSQNSKACTPVFTDLSSKHSSATIRAVIGIFRSRGHNSGLFSRPL